MIRVFIDNAPNTADGQHRYILINKYSYRFMLVDFDRRDDIVNKGFLLTLLYWYGIIFVCEPHRKGYEKRDLTLFTPMARLV